MSDMKKDFAVQTASHYNPISECIFYCIRRANGQTFRNELTETCRLYPENEVELLRLFSPIAKLEEKLDKLAEKIDKERFSFFFENHASPDTKLTIGSSIGSLVLMPNGVETEYSGFENYVASLCKAEKVEILVRMRCLLAVRNDGWFIDGNFDYDTFFDYVAAYPADYAWRFRILDVIRHFRDYANELYIMLAPLEKLIADSHDCTANATHWFKSTYGGQSISTFSLTSDGGNPTSFEESDELVITPSLFGFGNFRSVTFQPDSTDDQKKMPLTTHIDLMLFKNYVALCCKEAVSYPSIAACAKALADPTRLQILSILRHEESYTQELSDILELSFTATSHHMTKLMAAGLVTCEKRGSYVYYRPVEKTERWLLEKISDILLND